MDDKTRPHEYCRRRLWSRTFAAASVLFFMCLAGLWAGCTPTKRYQVLSIFFDGVPDPNAPPPKVNTFEEFPTEKPGKPRTVLASTHKPFADNNCAPCHKSNPQTAFEVSAFNTDQCLECHKSILKKYPVMHAPVAAKACLWCHEPHEAPAPHLLREPAPPVCVQCHEKELLSPLPPEHLAAKQSCLDCHTAHGGERHGLLRAQSLPTTLPTTKPAAGGNL